MIAETTIYRPIAASCINESEEAHEKMTKIKYKEGQANENK